MKKLKDTNNKEEKINGIVYSMSPSPPFPHGIVNGNSLKGGSYRKFKGCHTNVTSHNNISATALLYLLLNTNC